MIVVLWNRERVIHTDNILNGANDSLANHKRVIHLHTGANGLHESLAGESKMFEFITRKASYSL